MHRRQFSRALLGTPAALWSLQALAQTASRVPLRPGAPTPTPTLAPVEGQQFVRLSQPVPTGPAGRIEVLEFFWYGCPHCLAFEPALDAWVQRLPGDVSFQRVPVAFSAEPFGVQQRLFYALDSLGLLAALHRKVFYAIHHERIKLDRPAEIAAFMARHGIESARFMAAFESVGVLAKARQATQLGAAYKIDGVPALGVQGRFYTSASLAGGNEQALAVTDFLIRRVRSGA